MTSECPVCYGEKPLVVSPCRSKHAFCKDCLKILVRQHGPQFPCPVCRQTLRIPRGGVNRLPLLQPDTEGGATPAGDGTSALQEDGDDHNSDEDDDVAHRHLRTRGLPRRFMALLIYPPNRQRRDGQADPAPSNVGPGDQSAAHQGERRGYRLQPPDPPALPPLRWRPLQGPQDLHQPRGDGDRGAGPRGLFRTQGQHGNLFHQLARPIASRDRGQGRGVGRSQSFGGSTFSGGHQGRSGAADLTEDEQLALALQEAEYASVQTFRTGFNGHSGQNGGGPPYYRNPNEGRYHGSSFCPYHGRPFYPHGARFLPHQEDFALSDEELALRMQENELRAASQNARQHRHNDVGDDDDDDNLALRMQGAEIKAAMQMEKDRQMAEKLHQYDRGIINTQILTNGLKRLGCYDSAVHTAGDVVDGATGGTAADGEGGGKVPEVAGFLSGTLNADASDEDGNNKGDDHARVSGVVHSFVGGILNAVVDDADGGNSGSRGCGSCGCGSGGGFGCSCRGGRRDFDVDDDGPVAGGCGCEGAAKGGYNRL